MLSDDGPESLAPAIKHRCNPYLNFLRHGRHVHDRSAEEHEPGMHYEGVIEHAGLPHVLYRIGRHTFQQRPLTGR